MSGHQTEEVLSTEQIWREMIEQRWRYIQENIAEQEARLLTIHDSLSRPIVEQKLLGLKIAAMGVWTDAKRAGVTLTLPVTGAEKN